MGVVFRAKDPKLEREVAIKILANQDKASKESRTRMLREAKALAQLSHPNVVQVFEAGEAEDSLYIAMELVEGRSLGHWLEETSPTLETRLRVLAQAASGLSAAHTKGIVHRDFKPANVIVGRDGRVRVLDFGIASVARSSLEEATLTGTNQLVGTPRYMAPEQIRHAEYSPASDAFAFGLVAYEILAGRRAFDASTANALAVELVTADPPPLPRDLPAAVRRFIRDLLVKDPERRLSNLESVASVLFAEADGQAAGVLDRRSRTKYAIGGGLVAAVLVGPLLWLGLRQPEPVSAGSKEAPPVETTSTLGERGAPDSEGTETHPLEISGADIAAWMDPSRTHLLWRDASFRVFHVRIDGETRGEVKEIGVPGEFLESVAGLGPDESSAYVVKRDRQLVEVDLATGRVSPVIRALPRASNYLLDPTGTTIACVDARFGMGGASRIVFADLRDEGLDEVLALNPDLGQITGFAWSPTGDEFAFIQAQWPSGREGAISRLGRWNRSDPGRAELTTLESQLVFGLDWSPWGLEYTREGASDDGSFELARVPFVAVGTPVSAGTTVGKFEARTDFLRRLDEERLVRLRGAGNGDRIRVGNLAPEGRLTSLSATVDRGWPLAFLGRDLIAAAPTGTSSTRELSLYSGGTRKRGLVRPRSRSRVCWVGPEYGALELTQDSQLLRHHDGQTRQLDAFRPPQIGDAIFRRLECNLAGEAVLISVHSPTLVEVHSIDIDSGQISPVATLPVPPALAGRDIVSRILDRQVRLEVGGERIIAAAERDGVAIIDLVRKRIETHPVTLVEGRGAELSVQGIHELPNAEGWIATGILDDPLAYKIWRLDGDFRGVELWAFEHTYLSAVVVSKSGHRIAVSSRDVSLDFEVLRVQRPAVSAP